MKVSADIQAAADKYAILPVTQGSVWSRRPSGRYDGPSATSDQDIVLRGSITKNAETGLRTAVQVANISKVYGAGNGYQVTYEGGRYLEGHSKDDVRKMFLGILATGDVEKTEGHRQDLLHAYRTASQNQSALRIMVSAEVRGGHELGYKERRTIEDALSTLRSLSSSEATTATAGLKGLLVRDDEVKGRTRDSYAIVTADPRVAAAAEATRAANVALDTYESELKDAGKAVLKVWATQAATQKKLEEAAVAHAKAQRNERLAKEATVKAAELRAEVARLEAKAAELSK